MELGSEEPPKVHLPAEVRTEAVLVEAEVEPPPVGPFLGRDDGVADISRCVTLYITGRTHEAQGLVVSLLRPFLSEVTHGHRS